MLISKSLMCGIVSWLACSVVSAQGIFDRNLIQNSGAEAGPAMASSDDTRVTNIPNWTTTGTMTVGKYDGVGLLEAVSYGPADRGSNYFLMKDEPAPATATQTVDVSGAASEIDAGRVRFHLEAYIGGVHDAKGGLKATFLDAAGRALLDAVATTAAEEEFGTGGLLLRTATGYLLPNTRSVRLVLDLRSTSSGFGFPSADNLSLKLALEPLLGHNLIVNADAEAAEGEETQATWRPIPGWNTPSAMMAVRYAGTSLNASDPLPENRGVNLFAAYAISPGPFSMFQTIDVTLAKDHIDNGSISYQLSGWLGGRTDYADHAKLTLVFVDAAGRELGNAEAGPVTVQDRGGRSALLRRSREGAVPAGTRQLRVTLTMTWLSDPTGNIYAYADNIALALTSASNSVSLNRIANSASLASGPVAAGEMVTLFVSGVTLDSQVRMQLDPSGRVKNELGGVKVFFDGTQAPLLFVNSSQIGAVVPFDVDGKSSTQVRLEYQGVPSNTVAAQVAPAAPGVFTQEGTATGRGMVYTDAWTLNSSSNAAAKGSLVTIIWTGGGQMNPRGVDGRMENQALPRVAQPVTVLIGAQSAEVVYSGAVPFAWAGLLMTQAKVPAGAPTGDAVPVIVSAGGASSQTGVTIAVR